MRSTQNAANHGEGMQLTERVSEHALRVRPVRTADLPAVAYLMEALGYAVDRTDLLERLEWFVEATNDHVLVAELDGTVRGAIVLSLTRRFVEPGWFSRVTALVVNPSDRRLGVGRALLTEAERVAAAAGSTLMQINCGRRPERQAAHHFYSDLGYRDQHSHHILYDKRLNKN